MKFLERLALVIYSYIILILAIVLSLVIFNWINVSSITNILTFIIKDDLISKIALAINIIFILLSIKCIFFDKKSKERLRNTQGILFKNENGQLMISRETINNIVKNSISAFDTIKSSNVKIELDSESQIIITLYITVDENVVIKELASNLQTKVKEELKKTSDLEIKEVNVKIIELQDNKINKE